MTTKSNLCKTLEGILWMEEKDKHIHEATENMPGLNAS